MLVPIPWKVWTQQGSKWHSLLSFLVGGGGSGFWSSTSALSSCKLDISQINRGSLFSPSLQEEPKALFTSVAHWCWFVCINPYNISLLIGKGRQYAHSPLYFTEKSVVTFMTACPWLFSSDWRHIILNCKLIKME